MDVLDVQTGKTTRLTASDGREASLTNCEFASDTMLVCEFGGMANLVGQMVGFSRLVAVDTTKATIKSLGVRETDRDLGLHRGSRGHGTPRARSIARWSSVENGAVD